MIDKEDFIEIIPACISLFILLIVIPSLMLYSVGHSRGKKEGVNETTVSCMEKPNECKELYDYIKLSEKLGKAP